MKEFTSEALLNELDDRNDLHELVIEGCTDAEPIEIARVLLHALLQHNLAVACVEGHLHITLVRPEAYNDSPQKIIH